MDPSPEECARELLDVVPMVMRSIRTEMRLHRISGLSVPQFRAMLYLRRHPETSLIDVANHLGLTPPACSKLMDGLVARYLVVRQNSSHDRRRISLHLSAKGEQSLDSAERATCESLIIQITYFTPAERESLHQSLLLLKEAFADGAGNPEMK
jgi:DNA-binding MarR family transcriptional regulator